MSENINNAIKDGNQPQVIDQSCGKKNFRGSGYISICICSLLLFSSIVSVGDTNNVSASEKKVSIFIGVISCLITSIVILCEHSIVLKDIFDIPDDISEMKNTEGCVLLSLAIFWIIGVGVMTGAGGIAYEATNIYVTCWLCLLFSAYYFNNWLSSTNMTSAKDLTNASATTSSWYCLLLSSLLEISSASDLLYYARKGENIPSGYHWQLVLAIIIGTFSIITACFVIFVHYGVIKLRRLGNGNILELALAIFIVFLWFPTVFFLTNINGVASTITGKRYANGDFFPGSNLYASTWMCLFSILHVVYQWNNTRSVQFAIAEERIFAELTANRERCQQQKSNTKEDGSQYSVSVSGKLETVLETDEDEDECEV